MVSNPPYFLTHFLLYGTVLREKLNGLKLVKNLSAFYGTRSFNTAVTSARHLVVS